MAGRFSEQELEEFELAMLDDSELQQAVLQQMDMRDDIVAVSDEFDESPTPTLLDRLINLLNAPPGWGYAACVLVLATILVFPMQEADRTHGIQLAAAIIDLDATRSGELPTVLLQEGVVSVLSLDADKFGAETLDVNLTLDGQRLFGLTEVSADSEKLVKVVVGGLEAGDYLLQVGSDGLRDQYLVEVRAN